MKKQSFNFTRLILSEYVTILLTAAKGYMLFFTLVETTTNNSHYFLLCDVFLNCVESLLFSVMWEPAAADYTVWLQLVLLSGRSCLRWIASTLMVKNISLYYFPLSKHSLILWMNADDPAQRRRLTIWTFVLRSWDLVNVITLSACTPILLIICNTVVLCQS